MSPWGPARTVAILAMVGASVVIAASPQQPDPPKPKAPATGLIAGRVIDATTERPIAGALVTYPVRSESALTNAAGQFVLEGLPEGDLPLFASRFGYLTARFGQSHPTGPGSFVTLAAGTRVTDLVIRLWKRAAITGRVADEHGDPIVGLPVTASLVGFAHRGDPVDERMDALRAETDDRGIFRFGGLLPGDYLVFVPSTQTAVPRSVIEAASRSDPDHVRAAKALQLSDSTWELPGARDGGIGDGAFVRTIRPLYSSSRTPSAIYPTTFYPSATTAARAQVVSVGAGEERSGIDLVMRPVIGVRVSGRLSGSDGPVALQPLRLVHEAAADFAPATDPPVATTVTDASGAFTFIGVPPGQYRILSLSSLEEHDSPSIEVGASIVGGGQPETVMIVEAMAPPRAVDSKAKPVHWALLPVTVGETSVEGLEAAYRRGFRFSGRVVFEGSGPLPDAKEPWLTLAIERADGRGIGFDRWVSQGADELTVNARGEFETGTVPPGPYLIRVPGPPPGWQLKSAIVSGRDVSDDPVNLIADVDDLVLTFTTVTKLQGQVADAARSSHVGVLIFPTESARWTHIGRSPHRVRAIAVERDGRFSVARLPAGEYYAVAVRDPDRFDERSPRQLQELAAFADRVVVTQGESRAVTLRLRDVR